MKICICSSMAFYDQYLGLKRELEARGHAVLVPELERKSIEDDTLPPEHDAWKQKGDAMLAHMRKIDACEAVLLTNWEKNGQPDYIGANGFLEMGYAFATGKRIYILNNLPAVSPFREEMCGMRPIVLRGDIDAILAYC